MTEPVLDAQTALTFLAQAGGVLARSLDLERTLDEVARLAVPDIADWCAVEILEDDGELRQITSRHPDPQVEELLIELKRRYRSEMGAARGVRHVIATAESELVTYAAEDVQIDLRPDEGSVYERLAPRSYMIVPLIARGRTIGALTLLSTRPGRHYVESDLEVAQQLGRRFALSIDNARLYDEAEGSRVLLDTLFETSPVGLGFFDTDLRCVRVNGTLARLDGRPLASYRGRSIDEFASPETVVLYRRVLETGEPLLDYDMSTVRGGAEQHWIVSLTPVRESDGDLLGVSLVVIDATERRELLERERAARRRATFLVHAGEILDSSLDYETTLANVAEIAVPDVADWCAIHLLSESGAIRLVAVAHVDPRRERLAWDLDRRIPADPAGSSGIGGVIRTGVTEVVNEVTDEMLEGGAYDADHLEILRSLGLRGVMTAPLRARGRTFGAVVFVSAESRRRFAPEDVELAEELARRAGLAVDNARLYTERSNIAHTLQAELLPARLPTIPGAEIAVRYRAAGELNEVGGDFYDVYETSGGRWAFVIGDVSGKGAEAAAVTALARHTLRTASLQPAAPADLLETLNGALLTQRAGSEFCTVCLAHLELARGRPLLRVALGGHPPALVLRADGTVVALGAPGTLLGVFADPQLDERECPLEPGDTLLLYTDGVTEAGPTGTEIGEQGLARILAGLGGRSPQEIVDAVERAAVDASGGRQRDDIALVAVRIGPVREPRGRAAGRPRRPARVAP